MKSATRKVTLIGILFGITMLNTSFIGLRVDKFVFEGYFGEEQLAEGKKYFCEARKDSISVDVCRFYISSVELYQNKHLVATKDYSLLDLFDSTANKFLIVYSSYGTVTELRFNLGIDSTTNMAGVGKDDLDPTKGMYWTWQSGYINLKLEGRSNLCKTNRGGFQYHIGGYSAPTNSLRTVVFKVDQETGIYRIKVDTEKFFEQTDISSVTHVMSPSAKSQELADHAVKMFSLSK